MDDYTALDAKNGLHLTFLGSADGSGRTAAILFGNLGVSADNRADTPKTPEGIGISSTREELLAAYPDIQQTGTYNDVTYYGLTDDHRNWIVFGVMHDKVFEIQIGSEADLPIGEGTVKTIAPELCPA